jgi:hypothetical protein
MQGSTARSRKNYYNCDERELQTIGRSKASHNVRIATSDSWIDHDPTKKDDGGIVVETSYTIKRSHNDLDEVSLVSHEDRKTSGGRSV